MGPAEAYTREQAASTITSTRCSLRQLASVLWRGQDPLSAPWHTTVPADIVRVKAHFENLGLARATVNRHLSTLRGVLHHAWLQFRMEDAQYQRCMAVRAIKLPARLHHAAPLPGRYVSPREIEGLFESIHNDMTAGRSKQRAKEAALVAVAYGCGLRRGELAEMQLSGWDVVTRTLTVEHGKGDKCRLVPVPSGTRAALLDWTILRGPSPGALFASGLVAKATLSTRHISQQFGWLNTYMEKPFTPHDLRRSWITNLFMAGVDIATIASLAGHSSVHTTARYDLRPHEVNREAIDLLEVPYHGCTSTGRPEASTTHGAPDANHV